MKKYLAFTKVNLLHSISEIEGLAIWVIVGLLEVSLMMFLWMGADKNIISGYTQPQLIGYYILVFLLEPLLGWYIFWTIKNQIAGGNILNALSRPYNYFLYLIFDELGYRLIRCFFQVITVIALIMFLGNAVSFNITWESVLLSIPTILLAILLNLLMQFSMGCATFFWTETSFMQDLNWMLMSLFGGRFLPLDMFPGFMKTFLQYNPYAFMTALNIKVLNNYLSSSEYILNVGLSICWCLFFGLVSWQIWKIGNKKYSAFGK